ncbi:MAG TPA: Fe-S cluster assembly ATPase SufC [Candidatus Dormibacteraeota bacterium]|jgi:Fe-S cluster assembly ATP-binding protein|nr:Fe-S cluster assembly ATPase SufC [Candidatus Dormibacteraeota bacterium]
MAVGTATGVLGIKDLHASIEGKEILRGVDLEIPQGEVHALMGPNGSGKSTLAYTVMGHPKYEVTSGEVRYRDRNVLELAPDERAKLGLFLSFQYPTAIPGVTMHNFLRTATKALKGDELPPREFRKLVSEQMERLKMDPSFATRYVNDGFSGGEKKRAEILQLGVLQPEIAILDETDSGLDVDALRTVAEGVEALRGPDLGVLLITHYQRILNYITPDRVHVMYRGRIIKSGGADLALEIESNGYDKIISELGEEVGAVASATDDVSPAERAFAESHTMESGRENH